jgi:hypothetical protein
MLMLILIGGIKIRREKPIIDEMNKLGTDKDMKDI